MSEHLDPLLATSEDQNRQPEQPLVGNDGLSALACFSCKRRKVKCNRTLPACSLCQKIGAACEYPTHAEKPGPKAGTPQRNKRRRVGDGPPSVGQPDPGTFHSNSTPTEAGFAYDVAAGLRSVNYNAPSVSYAPRAPARRHSLPDVMDATLEQSANRSGGAPAFTQLMYPSHEERTRPHSPFTPEPESQMRRSGHITVHSVCEGLRISIDGYNWLMESYFANMTSYTLFKPGSIETKLSCMRSKAEAEALVAAMFSFAARFEGGVEFNDKSDDIPMPGYFAHIASQQLDRALNECGDTTPPLWVLQACILVTFYQLTRSVRSRSWRALGSCIRLAYDMQLHIVDANHDREKAAEGRDINIRRWSHMEERRRAWWAIWEMDVFASTIRRLPTAIDWAQNLTLLPVHDNYWFNDIYQNSSFLVKDPDLRWKCLAKTGNNSPAAWFIVINSIMRNTQLIVYPPGTAMQSPFNRTQESCQVELDIVANCLYCATLSIPSELQYNGETLDFKTKGSSRDITPRQFHCHKYTLHLMIQLARFMIHHHKICGQAPWIIKRADKDGNTLPDQAGLSDWSNYINAADEIVAAIRNSSKDHYKYVNPFLVNTVWFAAAAQSACKVFGPPTFDKRAADSNIELLRLTVDRFITFWGSADTLKGKLAKMEEGLRMLMSKGDENDPSRNQAQVDTTPATVNSNKEAETVQSGYTPAMSEPSLGQYGATPGAEATAQYGGIDPALTGAEYLPNPYDFTQSLMMPDPNAYLGGAGAAEYFPYGLEELLTYGVGGGGQMPPLNVG